MGVGGEGRTSHLCFLIEDFLWDAGALDLEVQIPDAKMRLYVKVFAWLQRLFSGIYYGIQTKLLEKIKGPKSWPGAEESPAGYDARSVVKTVCPRRR